MALGVHRQGMGPEGSPRAGLWSQALCWCPDCCATLKMLPFLNLSVSSFINWIGWTRPSAKTHPICKASSRASLTPSLRISWALSISWVSEVPWTFYPSAYIPYESDSVIIFITTFFLFFEVFKVSWNHPLMQIHCYWITFLSTHSVLGNMQGSFHL